jgi:hypothetical protein
LTREPTSVRNLAGRAGYFCDSIASYTQFTAGTGGAAAGCSRRDGVELLAYVSTSGSLGKYLDAVYDGQLASVVRFVYNMTFGTILTTFMRSPCKWLVRCVFHV